MIILTSFAKKGLATDKVRMPHDKIHMLQRQSPVDGKDFTAVFILGFPPYAVTETPEEIDAIIDAELKRLHDLKNSWDKVIVKGKSALEAARDAQ